MSALPPHLALPIRRLVRRVRPLLEELRDRRARVRSAREATEFVSAHPELAADLSVLERPDGKRVLVVSLSDDPEQVRLEALLIKALQVRGARVSVLTFRSSRRGVRELRGLGIRRLVFYEDHAPDRRDWAAEAARLAAGCRTVQDFKELEYRGARVGRHGLSTVVRARHEPRIDLEDPDVRAAIARTIAYAIEGVHTGEQVLDAARPDLLLMIERGYAGFGSIFDLALQRGIPVVQFQAAHRDDAFLMKRYTLANRELHPRSLDDLTWRRLLERGWDDDRERELEAELEAREEGKWFMSRRIRHAARRRPPEELRRDLGLDRERKVAVLFSHVLWDASMFYGRDVHADQGQWFAETVRLAAADERVQWLVKLHPALFWKLRADGVRAEPAELAMIRESVGGLPPHMRLLRPDDDVANADLFELVDAGVTIRGTVGLELPALGVPVLTAGTTDYGGRGFTVDAGSIDEYEANVRGIAALPRLTPEQTRLARLYAYGVFCVRPWRFDSFRLEYLPLVESGDTLLHRLRWAISTPAELKAADDLARFAAWVLDSDEADYTRAISSRQPNVGAASSASST
ncbi:MAG: hypothetical protein ABR521_10875 [Gaiellaceae bacterium]